MTRRAAVLAALAASFLPVPAPAADAVVPIARIGAPIAGEAAPASVLRPAILHAVFQVQPTDTALYVGTPWSIRDLTVMVVGPGERRRTIVADADLPGRILGVRLPADAWQADRIELEATTVSLATPPFLLTAEQLAQIAWRTWWYAAVFGALAALAALHATLAVVLRSRADGWFAAALAAQAGLAIPWLGLVRPPPEVSQPLHAALQSLAFAAPALFAFAFADRVRFGRRVRISVLALVTLAAVAIAGGDVLQDFWPLPDLVTQAAVAALDVAFVALGVVAARRGIAGARFLIAGFALNAVCFVLGSIFANDALSLAAPSAGIALAAPLLALALFTRRRSRDGEHTQRERPVLLDGLTGIANRPALDDALAHACERAGSARAPLAVLLIDLDHFRSYNELYGHLAGDDVLRRIAAVLVDTVSAHGATALAARFGGEKFLALLPGADAAAAQRIANAVLDAIAGLQIAHGGTPLKRLTASIGIASALPSEHTPATAEGLVRRASTALHVAKTMGRARAVADEPILAPPPRMVRC